MLILKYFWWHWHPQNNDPWKDLYIDAFCVIITCPIYSKQKQSPGYGCSFVAKLSWKKSFCSWKNICILYKIYVICRKICFYMEKKFYTEKFFYWKKLFYREKYKWECKKYVSHLKNIFIQKMFVQQTKYKSFLNMYSFCKFFFLIIQKIFVRNSLWTQ